MCGPHRHERCKGQKVKRCAKLRPSRDLFRIVLHAELGSDGLVFSVTVVGQHTVTVRLKGFAKS